MKFKKAGEDLAKVVAGPNGVPLKFTLIVGGKVTTEMRDKVIAHAQKLGIQEAEVWSGTEFEERLRRDTPALVQRFFEGVPFPETVQNTVFRAVAILVPALGIIVGLPLAGAPFAGDPRGVFGPNLLTALPVYVAFLAAPGYFACLFDSRGARASSAS